MIPVRRTVNKSRMSYRDFMMPGLKFQKTYWHWYGLYYNACLLYTSLGMPFFNKSPIPLPIRIAAIFTSVPKPVICKYGCYPYRKRYWTFIKKWHSQTAAEMCIRDRHQVSLDVRTAKIQETVFQTQIFFCLALFFNWERRSLRLSQDT